MVSGTVANCNRQMHTLKHVLDQDGALSDLLVDDELLVVGGDEEDHDWRMWEAGGREMVG